MAGELCTVLRQFIEAGNDRIDFAEPKIVWRPMGVRCERAGATVVVSRAPHQARIGLREADWTVVPVGGRPRVAQVSAWVLNGQVITVYASGPGDSGVAVRACTTTPPT